MPGLRLGAADLDVAIPIWTTTPWTLPASMAVSLHPALEYSLVTHEGRGLVIASDLVAAVCARIGWEDFTVVGTAEGSAHGQLEATPLG